MSTPHLTASGRDALDQIINKIIEDRSMPALFLGVASAQDILYENQDGRQDYDQPEGKRVDGETTALILVDQKRAKLHDADFLAEILPEIRQDRLEVIKGTEEDGTLILESAEKGITLAMLLSHSAGFAYNFEPLPILAKWNEANARKPLFHKDATVEDFIHPLLFQPGSAAYYGTGHDWAGFMIERITGQTLEEALRVLIFEPVGMTSTSFVPTSDIMSRLLEGCALDEAGNLTVQPEPLGKPTAPEELGLIVGSGGLFGIARDYLRFLQAVMRSSPKYAGHEKALLSKQSFESLFTGVLTDKGVSQFGKFVEGIWYHLPIGGINPKGIQHSPGLMIYLQGGVCGRKPGSGCWDGLMKTIYWLDPVSDIVAVCFTNIFSHKNDNVVGETVREFERAVYKGLEI